MARKTKIVAIETRRNASAESGVETTTSMSYETTPLEREAAVAQLIRTTLRVAVDFEQRPRLLQMAQLIIQDSERNPNQYALPGPEAEKASTP